MDNERPWKPRHWLAVASFFAGTVMAAVVLGGPAYAATPHSVPAPSTIGPIGGNNRANAPDTPAPSTQGPIGGNNRANMLDTPAPSNQGPVGGNP